MIVKLIKKVFGSRNERLLKRYRNTVRAINALEPQLQALSDEELAAHRWVTECFEPVIALVPRTLRGKLEPAEIYHEVLAHRWFMSERTGASVPFESARPKSGNTHTTSRPKSACFASLVAMKTAGITYAAAISMGNATRLTRSPVASSARNPTTDVQNTYG